MSKSNAHENAWLLLVFNAVGFADLADNDASSPATALLVSLHTADPGEAGSKSTNEITYPGYSAASVARTSGGWTVAANVASNNVVISWPACSSGGPFTATHFGISTPAGVLLYSGALTANLIINPGITPTAAAGSIQASED